MGKLNDSLGRVPRTSEQRDDMQSVAVEIIASQHLRSRQSCHLQGKREDHRVRTPLAPP